MKRIRIRPGKVIYVSDDLARKAAEVLERCGLTKEEVDNMSKAMPRRLPAVMLGPRQQKPSHRRSPSAAKIIAKVRRILEESGNPTAMSASDVERWVDVWMQTHQPALQGKTPTEVMQLLDGWDRVESLLEQLRDGGFA